MATAKFYGADQSALQQWFNVVDADRSGEVNTAELQQALAQGGLNFSMKLASSMIRMFDDDRNAQRPRRHDAATPVRPPSSPQRAPLH